VSCEWLSDSGQKGHTYKTLTIHAGILHVQAGDTQPAAGGRRIVEKIGKWLRDKDSGAWLGLYHSPGCGCG
jgi:hypothetical protein